MSNKTEFFKGVVATILVGMAILVTVYYYSLSKAEKTKPYHWYDQPVIMNIENKKDAVFVPGEGLIIRYHVYQTPADCSFTLQDVISGPVRYQFRGNSYHITGDRTARADVGFYFELPETLPDGKYKWSQMITPVCPDVKMRPYVLDTGLTVTVKKPVITRPAKPGSPPAVLPPVRKLAPSEYPKPPADWKPLDHKPVKKKRWWQ